MGKSAASNWAGRWTRGGRPDPLISSTVPDRSGAKRVIDMNKPCKDCGMIHVDPNFDYKTHSSQTKMSKNIGNALFKGL